MVSRWEQGNEQGRGRGSQEPAPDVRGDHREVEPDIRQRNVASKTMVQPPGRRGEGLSSQSLDDLANHGGLPGRGNLGWRSNDRSVSGSRPLDSGLLFYFAHVGLQFLFFIVLDIRAGANLLSSGHSSCPLRTRPCLGSWLVPLGLMGMIPLELNVCTPAITSAKPDFLDVTGGIRVSQVKIKEKKAFKMCRMHTPKFCSR